MVQRAG
jgi:hypothetical protein